MDTTVALQFGILILLLLLSAFFSSAETALTTANKIKMKALADEGDKKAKTVLTVTGDSGKMLSAILIGNNVVNLYAASLVTTIALKLWGNTSVAIASGVLTVLGSDLRRDQSQDTGHRPCRQNGAYLCRNDPCSDEAFNTSDFHYQQDGRTRFDDPAGRSFRQSACHDRA